MKDYYYILGLTPAATAADIKQAYRKLSLKFHPDQNAGDAFYTARYHDIQEAYDILSTPDRRVAYDRATSAPPTSPSPATPVAPTIDTFEVFPAEVRYGDDLTIRWATSHANEVMITGLGKVAAQGERRIKCQSFSTERIYLTLTACGAGGEEAENRQSVVNATYRELRDHIIADYEAQRPALRQATRDANFWQDAKWSFIIIIVGASLTGLLMWLIMIL